jgi:ribose transport system substrate-binding protein
MGDMATAYGLAYRVYNPENDPTEQIKEIEQARLEGAKAFVLCPLENNMLNNSISALRAANIPLVYITMFDHPYGVKQDSNSYEIGRVVGRLGGQNFVEEERGEARALVLAYPGFPAAETRAEGMMDGFREEVPDVTFVGTYSGFTEDVAYESVREALEDGVEFNVILSMTDEGAYGAIRVLQETGHAPDSVIIVSANGEPFAQELIREGTFLRGTVAYNREQSSQIAIDTLVKMLAGSPVPEFVSFPPGDVLTREVLAALGS